MKLRILLLLLFVVACAPLPDGTTDPDTAITSLPEDNMPANEPHLNPFLPKPGDENLTRGDVFISEASLVIRESFPPQISLAISGELPTPCHKLRVEIASPNQDNKIEVDVYSVVDPNRVCIQVLEPFQEYIDLGMLPVGHYSVWVNGELAGDFDK